MEQRKLSPSEIAECIRLARYLWGGGVGAPREARRDMRADMLLTSRKVSDAIKGSRSLQMFGSAGKQATFRAERTRSVEIAEEVLDWIRKNDIGAMDRMIGVSSLNALIKQCDKGDRAAIRESIIKCSDAMQNDIGADKLLHLLTSWA